MQEGGIPAIVTKELFDSVQERMQKNKRAPSRHKAEDDYLLTTKLFCGKCGATMVGECGTSRTGVTHRYYRCSTSKKKRACDKKTVKKDWIENLVVSKTMETLMNDKLMQDLSKRLFPLQQKENTTVPVFKKQLSDTQKAIGNMLNAIYLYDDKLVIIFNYQDGTKTIALDEVNGSDLSGCGVPKRLTSFISETCQFFMLCYNHSNVTTIYIGLGGHMKKRLYLILVLGFILSLSLTQVAYANMAAPMESDIASSITFEKNDTISVVSEVLDITVNGSKADMIATYNMKNITNESIATQSMFLSPNIENSGVKVVVNQKDTAFIVESYALNHATEIKTDDWSYAVLIDEQIASRNDEQTIDAITFVMEFKPNEEYDVVVNYSYQLGGYPEYDFSAKNGTIEYYLMPAAMWKDFANLTINLSLDKDMPVIKSSNLEFEKVGTRTYQYVSDTLPQENLEIVIDENGYQTMFSTLRSPYLLMNLMWFSPFILIALAMAAFVVWRIRKRKTHRR